MVALPTCYRILFVSHTLLHSVVCTITVLVSVSLWVLLFTSFCFSLFSFFFFAFCFQMLKTQEVIRRRHKNESNLFSSKRLIGSILLSCLDEGIQSYFLLDICFITLVQYCQGFKQVPSIFSRKIFMKNCFLRVILE